jgi:uncharacterized protein
MAQTERFAIDYTFWLNLVFLAITGVLVWLRFGDKKQKKSQQNENHDHQNNNDQGILEKVLFWLAMLSYIWLIGGLIVTLFQ